MSELREALPRATSVLEQGISAGLHLGAQVYVSVDGKPVADGAVGEARAGVPMTSETMITWFSMTKPTVAVSIGQLWERGLVDIEAPVAEYVPEFAQNGKERVTIRHCLTHTGGFRSADAVLSNEKDPDAWWDDVVARICRVTLEWEPGHEAGYHLWSSMQILGEIVRRVDGRRFADYVREEVFLPLGMDDCWVGMPRERAEAYGERLGTMHGTATGEPQPMPLLDSRTALSRSMPGGGGRGPMRQLARLYEALANGGGQAGARLLKPPTVAALTARHRSPMFDKTFGVVLDWGLGFGIDSAGMGRHCSPRSFGHGGARSSQAFADPDNGVVVAFQTNGMCTTDQHYRRMHAVSSAIYEDLGLASPDDPGRDKPFPTEGDVSA